MIISYFRSSSYNNWAFCQQQYFLSYVLGQEQQSNKKADKGTIVHKVLECLALLNLAMVNKQDFFIDEHVGKVKFNPKNIMDLTKLTPEEINKINATRKSKDKYKNQNSCMLKLDAVRYGVELVEHLIDLAYEYYTNRLDHHEWKPVDYKDCANWAWMALDYKVGEKQGLFDPRNRDIIDVEPHFDFELQEDWAKINTSDEDGNNIESRLSLKGTIDLVTKVNNDTLEIIDWKTGQRLNWANGNVKTFEDLKKDPQLLLYNRAVRHLYPEFKNVICTIFYIRDGGPFSIALDESHSKLMEENIQKRFNEIKNTTNPKMRDPKQKDWRCKSLCGFYKQNWPGTKFNMCRYIHEHTKKFGIEETIKKCTKDGHSVDKYNAPGEA